ncbi:pyranose oxidase [Thermocatellispora tengchongensis]|uniref:Pyranose oxidase n=1 Tax=Thermocatellispora tengchongensis TaxID=1073253 RepID=A0A840PLI1_9ACTN|nr:GMC oxidoreductase [Thermocatellispora tengchongensis]MBB5138480.1 pyranose oxidase [Thermocatellispora tengchongensis]
MQQPRVVVVGSGPIGATYARHIIENHPTATVLMVELGPQLTPTPGLNVRNIADPEEKARARMASQGPQAHSIEGRSPRLGIPAGTVVEGTFTARQGTHLIDFGGPGSGHAAGFPAAALSTCVGGQGAHWTCATPRPAFSEKIPFIPGGEWDGLIEEAEALLHTTHNAFSGSQVSGAIQALLAEEFAGELPDGFGPQILPVAGDEPGDGTIRWTGTDVVFGPLLDATSPLGARFELRPLTLAREILHERGRAVGVLLESRESGRRAVEPADLVIVAADAIRTPQLLWASRIRPPALGHYLTEHPAVLGTIALRAESMRRFADEDALAAERARRALTPGDPISAVNRIPFSEPAHPFAAQIMYTDTPPMPLPAGHPAAGGTWGYVNAGWGLRKFPRHEDAVTFSDDELDWAGMPAPSIRYELTEREHAEIAQATALLKRAAGALGEFVPGGEPRLMPNGSSLHYQGTIRMGESDDGTSVCDPWSRVWGFRNLFVGGNGVIPTATAVNPTLFSVALALRGARECVRRLRE